MGQCSPCRHVHCRTMLNGIDVAESVVTLDDSPAEVTCLVNHCYGGENFLVDDDNLLDCNRVAQKYDMPRLQKALDAFSQRVYINDDSAQKWITAAQDRSGMPKLKERCIAYMAKRLQHVLDAR